MSLELALSGHKAGLRAALVLAGALALGGCDSLAKLNPFDYGEKYEMKYVVDVLVEKKYYVSIDRL